MGIESDQAVYDYLSRVGDLAQATALTAAERARLVSGLRDAIDSRRGGTTTGSSKGELPAVKKILAGIGSPDGVVRRAVHNGVPQGPERGFEHSPERDERYRAQGPSVPRQGGPTPARNPDDAGTEGWWSRTGLGSRSQGRGGSGGSGRTGTGAGNTPGGGGFPSSGAPGGGFPGPGGPGGGFPGSGGPGGFPGGGGGFPGPGGGPGFPGGGGGLPGGGPSADLGGETAELPGWRVTFDPDFLDPDSRTRRQQPAEPDTDQEWDEEPDGEPDDETEQNEPPPRRSLLRRALAPRPAAAPAAPAAPPAAARPPLPLLESLAALLLVTAAVLNLWYVALGGWLIAYQARRIGRRAALFAAVWIPLLIGAACGYWWYTRAHGQPAGHRWTDAQAATAGRAAVSTWLRSAAACSTLFLAWRISRRH